MEPLKWHSHYIFYFNLSKQNFFISKYYCFIIILFHNIEKIFHFTEFTFWYFVIWFCFIEILMNWNDILIYRNTEWLSVCVYNISTNWNVISKKKEKKKKLYFDMISKSYFVISNFFFLLYWNISIYKNVILIKRKVILI